MHLRVWSGADLEGQGRFSMVRVEGWVYRTHKQEFDGLGARVWESDRGYHDQMTGLRVLELEPDGGMKAQNGPKVRFWQIGNQNTMQ